MAAVNFRVVERFVRRILATVASIDTSGNLAIAGELEVGGTSLFEDDVAIDADLSVDGIVTSTGFAGGSEALDSGSPSGDALLAVYDGLSGPVAATLPAATTDGKLLIVKNADDSEDVTVASHDLTLSEDEAAVFVSDGSAWHLITTDGTVA